MLLSSPLLSLCSSPFLSFILRHVGTTTVLLLQDLLWAQPLRAGMPTCLCSGDSRALPAARNPSAPHRDAPGHAAGTPLLWVQQTGGPGVGLSAELKHTSYSDMYEMQLTAEFSAQERSPETLFPF